MCYCVYYKCEIIIINFCPSIYVAAASVTCDLLDEKVFSQQALNGIFFNQHLENVFNKCEMNEGERERQKWQNDIQLKSQLSLREFIFYLVQQFEFIIYDQE